MAVYLSPGVFPREIDLSQLPTAFGPLRPAFVGTAKKGPLNEATFISTAAQYIETFGEPFPESYLGYAVLAYLEEGNQCYVMRVGIEYATGQDEELDDICIDTSGAKGQGWGRLPLFKGIDYGRISLREISADDPLVFHDAETGAVTYSDVEYGTDITVATLGITGTYTGSIDDSYSMVITSDPSGSDGSPITGAEYEIVRNSDGEIVAEGALTDPLGDGNSEYISIEDGLSVRVEVTSGTIGENDTFIFAVRPSNRDFTISVEGVADGGGTMPAATYTTVAAFVAAANLASTGSNHSFEEYTLEDDTVIPQIQTTTAGQRIQLTGTAGFALECGTLQYAWDIPRAFLLGLDEGPNTITTQNNRVKINIIAADETTSVTFNVPVGSNQTTESIASSVNAAGVVAGERLWDSFALTIPGGTTHLAIVMSSGRYLDTIELLANYSNLATLRFAEEMNFIYPYTRSYRGFYDSRVILPDGSVTDPAVPESGSVADSAYYENIVGFLVAPSAGTWADDLSVSLAQFTGGPVDNAGKYTLIIRGSQNEVLEQIQDISFDSRETRYIGNILNPGTSLGGTNGNAYANWEARPSYLDNDVNLTSFDVRLPAHFNSLTYSGQADGIPTDPAYSSELDAVVVGSPALSTGLYAFQNPEAIDINLLITPGFTTGAVIGTALQVCESRGDVLYIVDPPFGLRPQQAVDWHNGMLVSDLSTAINSSYGALYWSWLRVFDQFSADEIWVPPSGHIAAVFSRTSRDAEQWFAPAGLRRGRLLTALDVEYSPTQGERDLLYGSGNAVNPIVKFPQDGITVWGQRTLQRTQSALDRVNVRMLMIYLKKNLTRLLRSFIFEPNDRALWSQVNSTIDPFLGDVQARRGMQAYSVVCDESNNTPERIDRNELWVTVFVRPTRTAEFVVLNLVVMRTGSSFSAEESLAAAGIAN